LARAGVAGRAAAVSPEAGAAEVSKAAAVEVGFTAAAE